MYRSFNGIALLFGIFVLFSMIIGCKQKNCEQATQDERIENDANVRTLSMPPMKFRPHQFESAVKIYTSGDIKDEDGMVELPDALAGITVDGFMYVTKTTLDELFLFVTWRGKGSNLRGYLYQASQGHISSEALMGTIEVLGPTIWDPGYGKIDIDIEGALGSGWYQVKRDLD